MHRYPQRLRQGRNQLAAHRESLSRYGYDLPRSLLLPVETTNREFDGKLLLALKALELGYEPIIGSRTAMHAVLPSLPKSIYLAKGVRSGSARVFSLLEALGHIIVAFDEEALVRFPDEAFHMKLDPETFNRPRLLYAWGKSNADVWRSFRDYRGTPVLEAGNPRIDMLRPEIREYYRNDCEALQQRYGRFVLLSSNFAFVNHFIPNHVRHRIAKSANKAKSDSVKSGFAVHKQALFEKFLVFIPNLAKAIAPHALLIRPHPSENAAAWQDAAKGFDNVHVLHERPIAPWLMAAHVLVQTGCTSAVEASVLGTPAIAYRPVRSTYDLDLPNKLSLELDAAPAVIEACQMQLSRNSAPTNGPTPEQMAVLENLSPVSPDRSVRPYPRLVRGVPGRARSPEAGQRYYKAAGARPSLFPRAVPQHHNPHQEQCIQPRLYAAQVSGHDIETSRGKGAGIRKDPRPQDGGPDRGNEAQHFHVGLG